MILVVFLWLLAIGLLTFSILLLRKDNKANEKKQRGDSLDTDGSFLLVVAIVLLIAVGLTTLFFPIANQTKIQEMTAFYNSNVENYLVAYEEAYTIISKEKLLQEALIPIEGSIEKSQIADKVVELLITYRDEVNSYNISLQKYTYFHNHLLVGFYYPKPPEELKPLTLR